SGTATVEGVPVGAFAVSVQSSTLRVGGAVSATLTAAGTTLPVLVQLGPAGDVKGRVVLPDGNATPVPGAFVTIDFVSQTSFPGTIQRRTDALRRFELDAIPVGPFAISVFEPLSGGLRKLGRRVS